MPGGRPGEKVQWRERASVFRRALDDSEHAEVVIGERIYRGADQGPGVRPALLRLSRARRKRLHALSPFAVGCFAGNIRAKQTTLSPECTRNPDESRRAPDAQDVSRAAEPDRRASRTSESSRAPTDPQKRPRVCPRTRPRAPGNRQTRGGGHLAPLAAHHEIDLAATEGRADASGAPIRQ